MKCLLVLFATLSLLESSSVSAETWLVIADEWPPYACAHCPGGGAAIQALRESLATVGVDLEVAYFPWVRAIKETKLKKYDGYLTWKESLQPGYLLPTKALFRSPMVFVELKEKPLAWKNLKDLKGKRIGVIEGSGYFPEFMDLVKQGVIKAVPSNSDDVRIRLVRQGRLDGALLDMQNALYYLRKMPSQEKNMIQISRIVVHQDCYLAIQVENSDKIPLLEKALQNRDTQKLVDDYVQSYFSP